LIHVPSSGLIRPHLVKPAGVIAFESPVADGTRIHLQSWRTGVMDVVTAVITAERENMTTSTTQENGSAQAPAGEKPKATKKGSCCATGRPRCEEGG
jgi:hypothetical protein